jgi:hypothetical protein
MRPNTLAEAIERIQVGASWGATLAEFVDTFDLTPTTEARYVMLAGEPALTNDKRLDALVGAIAEYLAKQHRLGRVPTWASEPARYLDRPWHTSSMFVDWTREFLPDAIREYLTFASAGEFASRNIFTDERPLRRAPALNHQSGHRPE